MTWLILSTESIRLIYPERLQCKDIELLNSHKLCVVTSVCVLAIAHINHVCQSELALGFYLHGDSKSNLHQACVNTVSMMTICSDVTALSLIKEVQICSDF